MKIFVTGGLGYKGSLLVKRLADLGHHVTVYDSCWFGKTLVDAENIEILKGDLRFIRDDKIVKLDGTDLIIHLASVANDPCGDLDPKLTWEVSALGTLLLVQRAIEAGVTRFIYASSGSVYGTRPEERVIETTECTPISEYNKTKMVAERVLESYSKDIKLQIVRPATVCGLSPRLRLDLTVNMLTYQALKNGEITLHGGDQIRPHIHIDDIVDLYIYLVDNESITGIYNAGFENISLAETASHIAEATGAKIRVTESIDPRSYRLDSSKLLKTGFRPKKTMADAVVELVDYFKHSNFVASTANYNLKQMETLCIK